MDLCGNEKNKVIGYPERIKTIDFFYRKLNMTNKAYTIITLVSLLIFNIQCQTKEQKQEDKKESIVQKVETRLISIDEVTAFKEHSNEIYDIKELQTSYNKLEKLGEKSSEKFEFKLVAKKLHHNNTSYSNSLRQRITVSIFNYENAETTNQVKTDLLKCFPNDCSEVREGYSGGYKTTPAIYIFDERYIAVMNMRCEDEDGQWEKIKNDFLGRFRNENSKVIEAGCGKISWLE
jgi:hypothetical protein